MEIVSDQKKIVSCTDSTALEAQKDLNKVAIELSFPCIPAI